jgi:hypothetical protein
MRLKYYSSALSSSLQSRSQNREATSCEASSSPLSALMFVNFFIMNLLAKEYSKYDEEYQVRMQLADAKSARGPVPAEPRPMIRRPQLAH